MKIQVITSKESWLYNNRKNYLINFFKKYSKKIKITTEINKIEKNDVLVILSFYKIIPAKYLNLSKFNLIAHESDLPRGRGMSPLYTQILNGSTRIVTTILEAAEKVDSGNFYIKKSFYYPKDIFFEEIKERQLNNALYLLKKILIKIIKFGKIKSYKQIGNPFYYKRRVPNDSEININLSIKRQLNLLRIADNNNYPIFFKYKRSKIFLKVIKEKK
jgi:methionyl-tRNA formyltransferase